MKIISFIYRPDVACPSYHRGEHIYEARMVVEAALPGRYGPTRFAADERVPEHVPLRVVQLQLWDKIAREVYLALFLGENLQ